MSEIEYENFIKKDVLLVNEHQSDQKKCYKRIPYTFSLCNCLCQI